MLAVAAMASAGWLFLLVVLLAAPPSPGPRRGGGPGDGTSGGPAAGTVREPGGNEPPAVVSLLAGKLDRTGFGATLAGLAAQGWFQVRPPAPPPGPAMYVVPAEAPGGSPTPFERRVVAHVALRAGAAGQVPAPALADGFEGGETDFMAAFKEEVDAEARRRGLTRPRLSGRRIGWLCLLLFVPAGTVPGAAATLHQRHGLAWAAGFYLAGCVLAIGVGVSRRRSAAGQAALERWRWAVAVAPGDARLLGYAAALGSAPAALAVFAAGKTNTAWSSYRGGWQQLEIETNTTAWPLGCLAMIAIGLGPVAYFGTVIWLGTNGMAGLARDMIYLVVAGAAAAVLVWLARRSVPPPYAEFDGQVIRQWMVSGDDDSPDEWHVAVDDGTRETAWDFSVGSEPWRRLTPGTFVHARVNLRDRTEVTVAPVEPPAVAGPLADVAADQQRAATKGLPDPEELVTRDEAAVVLSGPVMEARLRDRAARMGRSPG